MSAPETKVESTPAADSVNSAGRRRPDASMTLLTEMLHRPLDPGYAAQAARRAAAGLAPTTGGSSWRFAVALLVAGVLFGVSAATLTATATGRSATRADLITQIEAGRSAAEARSAQITSLNAQLAVLDAQALARQPGRGEDQLASLAQVTGAAAVKGPGLVLTIDNAADAGMAAPNADPRSASRNQDGVVRARDLQIVANGLWAAGAEAISINDQRLTSLTAIRFAGEALIVNYRPLTRPYVITAIGDPSSLPAAFANSSGGSYLSALSSNFGISVHTTTSPEVIVPASSAATTRVARPLNTPPTASSTASTPSPAAVQQPSSLTTSGERS